MPQFWPVRKKNTSDTVEAAVLMHGEHVGVDDAARIDALVGLDRRERREPVAQAGSAFEVERLGGAIHLAGKFLLDGMASCRTGSPWPHVHQLGV